MPISATSFWRKAARLCLVVGPWWVVIRLGAHRSSGDELFFGLYSARLLTILAACALLAAVWTATVLHRRFPEWLRIVLGHARWLVTSLLVFIGLCLGLLVLLGPPLVLDLSLGVVVSLIGFLVFAASTSHGAILGRLNWRNAGVGAGLILVSTALSLLVIEGGMRLTNFAYLPPIPGFVPTQKPAAGPCTGLFKSSDFTGWGLCPGYSYTPPVPRVGNTHYESGTITINSRGGFDNEPAPGKNIVLVLGDSFIENLAVPIANHFGNLLERKFPDYDFLNLGVSGFNNVQSYRQYHRFRRDFPADNVKHVIFAIYFGNDFKENVFYDNASRRGVSREDVPYWSNGRIVWGDASATVGQSLDFLGRRHSQFYRAVRHTLIDSGVIDDPGEIVAREIIATLSRELHEHGIGLTVLLIPDDAMVRYGANAPFRALKAFLERQRIGYVSLLEPFVATGRETMGFKGENKTVVDFHWNGETNKLVAEYLAAHWTPVPEAAARPSRKAP